jgi:hypothetical protein
MRSAVLRSLPFLKGSDQVNWVGLWWSDGQLSIVTAQVNSGLESGLVLYVVLSVLDQEAEAGKNQIDYNRPCGYPRIFLLFAMNVVQYQSPPACLFGVPPLHSEIKASRPTIP